MTNCTGEKMKNNLEKISSVRQALKIEAAADAVEKAFEKAIGIIKNEASIPGFRKGKIPDKIIAQKFGEDVAKEAAKQIVLLTFSDAVTGAEVKFIGEPEFVPEGNAAKGKPFVYKAYFDVYPEYEADGYTGLKLEQEKFTVTDEEVEGELKRLQMQLTQLEPAPDSMIGPGLIAMIDFKGTADGKPFAGSEAENYVVDFGSGQMLEEFEVEIKGMKAKEERDIKFTYPKTYFKTDIAGKKGEFRVKVRDVRRKIVPELNDEFAKELGKFTTLAEVKKDLREKIAEFKGSVVKNGLRDKAIHLLIEKNQKLEVPLTMVQAEINNMLEQMDRNLRAHGKTLADQNLDAKEFVAKNEKEAKDRARGYVIISAIAKKENITTTDAEVEERLKNMAAQNRQPFAKVKEHFEKNNLMQQLKSQITFEKTLDFVVDKAKITEVKPKTKK